MSNLGNINSFGSITSAHWQDVREKFEEDLNNGTDYIDKNTNGYLESDELINFLNTLDLSDSEKLFLKNTNTDTFFSSVAKSSQADDNLIDIEELELQEKKMKLQEEVNSFIIDKSKSGIFSGKNSSFIIAVRDYLKTSLDDYVKSHMDSLDDIDKFKTELEAKYNEIIEDYFPTTKEGKQRAKSAAIDEVMKSIPKEYRAKAYEILSEKADEFIETYDGSDMLKDALAEHLKAFLKETDATKVKDEKTAWTNAVAEAGAFVDEADLETLKDKAIEVLQNIINKDVEITFNGKTFDTGNIDEVATEVSSFEDGEKLKTEMDKALKSISAKNVITKLKEEVANEQKEKDNKTKETISETVNNVLDYFIKDYKDNQDIDLSEDKTKTQALGEAIHKAAKEWAADNPPVDIKAEDGTITTDFTTFENNLTAHLIDLFSTKESELINGDKDVEAWNEAVKDYHEDNYTDEDEFATLKDKAIAYIKALVKAEVEIEIGDKVYTDLKDSDIEKLVKGFKTAAELVEAIESINITNLTKVDKILGKKQYKKVQEGCTTLKDCISEIKTTYLDSICVDDTVPDSHGNYDKDPNLDTQIKNGEMNTTFGIDNDGKIVFANAKTQRYFDRLKDQLKISLKDRALDAFKSIENSYDMLFQSAWIMAYSEYNSGNNNNIKDFVSCVFDKFTKILEAISKNSELLDLYTSRTAYANTAVTDGVTHYNTNTTYGDGTTGDERVKYSNPLTYLDGTIHITSIDDGDYQKCMESLLENIQATEPYSKLPSDKVVSVFRKAQADALKTLGNNILDLPYGTSENSQRVEDGDNKNWKGFDRNRDGDHWYIDMDQLVQITLYYFDKYILNEFAQ